MLIILIISFCPLWSFSHTVELKENVMPVQDNRQNLIAQNIVAIRKEDDYGYSWE
jgi:hypothetical protein